MKKQIEVMNKLLARPSMSPTLMSVVCLGPSLISIVEEASASMKPPLLPKTPSKSRVIRDDKVPSAAPPKMVVSSSPVSASRRSTRQQAVMRLTGLTNAQLPGQEIRHSNPKEKQYLSIPL